MTISTATPQITLAMSRADGAMSAIEMISDGRVREQMIDADGVDMADGPGSFDWNDPKVCLGDAAYAAFFGQTGCGSRHYDCSMEQGWEGAHFDQFLSGFESIARLAFRGERS